MRGVMLALILLLCRLAFAQTVVDQELSAAARHIAAYDFKTASQELQDVLRRDPGNAVARLLLGDCLWEQEDYPGALTAYMALIQAKPKGIPRDDLRRALDRIGMCYGMMGQLNRAEAWYKSIIPDDPNYPHYFYNLACTYAEKGDRAKALDSLKLAIERRSFASSTDLLPNPATDPSFRNYAEDPEFLSLVAKFNGTEAPQQKVTCQQILAGIGPPPELRAERNAAFEKARARAHLGHDSACELFLVMFQAKAAWSAGEPTDAVEFYRRAAKMAEEDQIPSGASAALQSLGDLYRQAGNYMGASEVLDRAEQFARRAESDAAMAAVLNSKGNLALARNDSAGALKYQSDALSLARKIEDKSSEAGILNDIGGVYSQNGQYSLALNEYLLAAEASQSASDTSFSCVALLNVGIAYRHLGMLEQAKAALEKANTLLPEVIDPIISGRVKNAIAEITASTGHMRESIPLYKEALAEKIKAHDDSGAALTVANIGAVMLRLGEYDEASRFVSAALHDAEDREDTWAMALFWDSLGVVREAQKNEAEALQAYLKSIDLRGRIRVSTQLAELRAAQAVLSSDAYERAVYIYAHLGKTEEAFNLAERARARTLLELLADPRVKPAISSADPALQNEKTRIEASITALEDKLRSLPRESADRRSLAEIRIQLERNYEDLDARLESSDPQFATLSGAAPRSIAQIQADLPVNATLISYFVTSSGVVAFVVHHDGEAVMQLLPATRQQLSEAISDFRRFSSLDVVPKSLITLYRLLVAPIESKLQTERLFIEPHDVLHLISFAALTPDGRQWFGAEHSICYLPAASVFAELKSRKKSPAYVPLIAFAESSPPGTNDPLLQADAESDSAAALFKGRAVHFASEEDFRSLAPNAAIVHIAAHATLNVVQPSLSAVIFAPSGDDDGLLHVSQIPNINLSATSLVVLGACDSGFGPQAAGDEIASLNRSFLLAGASSVLSSLWKVNDGSSASFMQAFYSFLAKGEPRADALRDAQDVLRAEYEHPFYWAGFTLMGEPGWR